MEKIGIEIENIINLKITTIASIEQRKGTF